MSHVVAIIGESARGKTAALRNLDPTQTLLIQVVDKALPFENARHWVRYNKEHAPHGNVFVSDKPDTIMKVMAGTKRNVIVIDDFQYTMSNEFMNRHAETGYAKFTEIAFKAWSLITAAHQLPLNKRVYILTHTETTDDGTVRVKTIGKLLNEKLTIEGLFATVLHAMIRPEEEDFSRRYVFATRSNGRDPTKTPMGMWSDMFIPNDIAAVDARVCEYYGLNAAMLLDRLDGGSQS